MLSVRFDGSLNEIVTQMREFIGLVTVEPRVQSVAPAEQATPKPVSTKKVEKPAEPEPTTPPPSHVEASLGDVKAMSVRLAKAKGRQTVVDLLKEFGAQSGADVKEEDRATYIAKAQAMIPA